MNVARHAVCVFEYTLTDPEGEVIDSSEGAEPLAYIHGTDSLISGLEAVLEGKTVGDTFKVTIPPEDAYGEYDETLVEDVSRSEFEDADELEVGSEFEVESDDEDDDEPQRVVVIEINDDTVKIDGNHALAGIALTFDVKIIEVRPATPEELEHGHVHGAGGHHH